MSERQLHLFEPAKPLLQRFGDAFFRAVPPRPGVYIMCGDEQRVLYIGQSRNLRVRLASYKNARPDRAPRKVIRLVHAVRSIAWEECASGQSAILKENELLRTHRPRFNRMNTWPRAHRFIEMQVRDSELILGLVGESASGGMSFGAFKGAAPAFAALMRLLWTALHQPVSACDLPAGLSGVKSPTRYSFDLDTSRSLVAASDWLEAMKNFLSGASDGLLARLSKTIPGADDTFQRNLMTADLELLALFYERGPRRNRELRQCHEIADTVIPQERLDDLHVIGTKTPAVETLGEA